MKGNYKYHLGEYREVGKVVCPWCGKKSFVRLIENETGKILDGFGRCDHDTCPSRSTDKSGIVYPGKDIDTSNFKTVEKDETPKVFYDWNIVRQYTEHRQENTLCRFLLTQVKDKDRFDKILQDYYIGSINNDIIFWQIDQRGNVHRGKIMKYNSDGHRQKTSYAISTMRQKQKRPKNIEPEMCYFGQHLIQKDRPIGIVESEKTAIIASYFLPQLTWIATLSLNNFNANRIKFLNGFKYPVYVFPDYDGYEKWTEKVEYFKVTTKLNIKVNQEVKKYGNGKQDIADLLLNDLKEV